MHGIIVKLHSDKGFGFLRGEDGIEYFFHRSCFNGHFDDLEVDFRNGRKLYVTFEFQESAKGPRAVEVTLTD